jgi:hypothetical protein
MCKSFPVNYFKYILLTAIYLNTVVPVHSNIIQTPDSVINKSRYVKPEELIRGERLFYGLVYQANRSINCTGCHNTRSSDTLNWNPDALEISRKYSGKSAGDLSKVLLNPSGLKMAQVHKNFQFSPEDIELIKAYMDKLPDIGLKQNKPVVTNVILFIIASILFLISTADLIITKRSKKKWINVVILFFTTVYITWRLVVDSHAIGRSHGYSPDQPIKFSHEVHVGQNGTDCIYCHCYAPYSKTAGIPPENVCMNCHLLVRNGKRSGAFEISKILSAFETKKSIEWVKVHNLPDHVFFSHAQHISSGGIACKDCHGTVEKMTRITQVSDLSMGWCVNCHRTRKVNFQENKFFSEYQELTNKMQKGEIDSVTVERLGGTECMKCHY